MTCFDSRSSFSRAANSSPGAIQMTLPFLRIARPFCLQDDLQRLIPGHVIQAQRHVAGHRVADHDVEVGDVGEHMQQFAQRECSGS